VSACLFESSPFSRESNNNKFKTVKFRCRWLILNHGFRPEPSCITRQGWQALGGDGGFSEQQGLSIADDICSRFRE